MLGWIALILILCLAAAIRPRAGSRLLARHIAGSPIARLPWGQPRHCRGVEDGRSPTRESMLPLNRFGFDRPPPWSPPLAILREAKERERRRAEAVLRAGFLFFDEHRSEAGKGLEKHRLAPAKILNIHGK